MAGIGKSVGGKLVTIQQDVPNDIDGILDAVRKVLLLGEVQSVVLRNGEPLTYQRFVRADEEIKPSESTASFAELTPMDIVRRVRMEEHQEAASSADPSSTVMRMVVYMGFDGWAFTHLVLGENTMFWEWLGIPPMVSKRLPQFLGARIEYEKTLPANVFVLCGSETKNASIAEIKYALKGNIV